jgi:putative inorganic carbon (HCO3(-)) transporter
LLNKSKKNKPTPKDAAVNPPKDCATISVVKAAQKVIFRLFGILLFLTPLILWPKTSEVFEFNKMVLVYILTALITASWLIRCIIAKKFIFRRTILDIPLLFFLGSQLISTVLSIDPATSWLGYYSRFNGGFLSTLCYSLLYWAFVSNLDRKSTLRTLYLVLTSALIVSLYGILEHFGIDKNVWVQDVQLRVFSTLGQPNWLAAYLVALIPITWAQVITNHQLPITNKLSGGKIFNSFVYFGLSILFFWTLLFTKSRSGLLGIAVADIVFWVLSYLKIGKGALKPFVICHLSFIIICLISGSQFSPSLSTLIGKSGNKQTANVPMASTALESGGTESGVIRKIVWKGALDVWRHYPVFGSGVETFAYSYYLYRPIEHNLTSEWDFIYNKAHNEFLNIAANSGAVGLMSYLALIGFTFITFIKLIINNSNLIAITNNLKSGQRKFLVSNPGSELLVINLALLAGYTSLLVTNFFGFSVVPTQLFFFLFPAFSIVISTEYAVQTNEKQKVSTQQKIGVFCVLCTVFYVLFSVGKYWYADTRYKLGKNYNAAGGFDVAAKYLIQAISLEPNQPLYHAEIAGTFASQAKPDSSAAIAEINRAVTLSPANVNLRRVEYGVLVMLATVNPDYLIDARDVLLEAVKRAPTDAKLLYNLGLAYARLGQDDLALATLKKTVEIKANYRDARLAYAILLLAGNENAEAKTQLMYILKYITPNDSLTKQTLESIK